jgi:hypothetical protein
MTKALLITLMLLTAADRSVAWSRDDADPECPSRLLRQRAIEHGHHHQPTTAEIACKQAVGGKSSTDTSIRRTIAPSRGVTLEKRVRTRHRGKPAWAACRSADSDLEVGNNSWDRLIFSSVEEIGHATGNVVQSDRHHDFRASQRRVLRPCDGPARGGHRRGRFASRSCQSARRYHEQR